MKIDTTYLQTVRRLADEIARRLEESGYPATPVDLSAIDALTPRQCIGIGIIVDAEGFTLLTQYGSVETFIGLDNEEDIDTIADDVLDFMLPIATVAEMTPEELQNFGEEALAGVWVVAVDDKPTFNESIHRGPRFFTAAELAGIDHVQVEGLWEQHF